jgi:hypothetical protein
MTKILKLIDMDPNSYPSIRAIKIGSGSESCATLLQVHNHTFFNIGSNGEDDIEDPNQDFEDASYSLLFRSKCAPSLPPNLTLLSIDLANHSFLLLVLPEIPQASPFVL